MSTTGRLPALSKLLAASLLAAAPAAEASELAVSPILVELSPRAPTALLSVKNEGAGAVRLQIRAFSWAQDVRGEMVLTPTDAVVVFPPLLELAPGATRNVRLGTTAPQRAAERSFRIFVEELPSAVAPPSEPAVRVLTRIGIPVFLAPLEARAKAELVTSPVEGRRVQFSLRNRGTVRLRPSSVRAAFLGADGRPLGTAEQKAWYVLAGDTREYAVEVPAAACAATRHVELTVVLDQETLTGTAAVPKGACGP